MVFFTDDSHDPSLKETCLSRNWTSFKEYRYNGKLENKLFSNFTGVNIIQPIHEA